MQNTEGYMRAKAMAEVKSPDVWKNGETDAAEENAVEAVQALREIHAGGP